MNHEGKNIKRDINKAIRFYKEASNFNNQFAKNNLGVIYKNGFDNPNINLSIEYFNEAIHQKKDKVAMYNLACLYFDINEEKSKIIELLFQSSNQNFYPSKELLCLTLINEFGFDYEKIHKEMLKYKDNSKELFTDICRIMEEKKYENIENLKERFNFYKSKDFLYNYLEEIISLKDFLNNDKRNSIQNKAQIFNISSEFYNGFGNDLLQLKT